MEKYEVITFENGEISVDVNVSPKEDTVWLSKEQMSLLFNRDRTVIGKHINNIFKEHELNKDSVSAFFAHTASDGKTYRVEYFNLDMIISVGYRVKSSNGIAFRKWATSILKEYLLKGYVISDKRTLVTNENYIQLINDVNSLKNDVHIIQEKLNTIPEEKLLFEGEVFDAFVFINDLFKSAKKSINIIDGYLDDSVFKFLQGINKQLNIQLITHKSNRISEDVINLFEKQYCKVNIIENKTFHDRFIIVDDTVYHLGSSLNTLANKTTTIIKMNSISKDALLTLIRN